MFYHQREHNHCATWFLFIISIIAAFLIGQQSEKYGYALSMESGERKSKNNSDTDLSDPYSHSHSDSHNRDAIIDPLPSHQL